MHKHLDNHYHHYQKEGIYGVKFSPQEIKSIRRFYDLSQKSFADMLGVSVRTLQNYEIGHRVPSGSSCALLKIAKEHPEFFKAHYLNYSETRGFRE